MLSWDSLCLATSEKWDEAACLSRPVTSLWGLAFGGGCALLILCDCIIGPPAATASTGNLSGPNEYL